MISIQNRLIRVGLPLFLWVCHCFSSTSLGQAYKEAVGYNRLLAEVGPGLQNGAGVSVAIVEADTDVGTNNSYFPQTANSEFSGKTFTDQSNLVNRTNSGHATEVAKRFFGNTSSMASGVTSISVFDAGDFIFNKQALIAGGNPASLNYQVVNHSYVSQNGLGNALADAEANARLDFTIARDNITSVVAANNGNTTNNLPKLYTQSYNSISVGLTSGDHSAGLTNLNGSLRIKPDIVAPEIFTSYATPIVSSSAALLHQAATNFGSPDAHNSEVMKAIIMAGATKDEFSAWNNSQDANHVTTRPLDLRYGAGELNVYNSYKILQAGESNGSALASVGLSGLRGWDYGNLTAGGSNLFWNFQVAPGQSISEASILLTWNADYSVGPFSLANLDLRLYNSSTTLLGSQVAASLSTVDNVEHLYLKDLAAGLYTIVVSGNATNPSTDFGLAWNITAVPEPSGVLLITAASSILCFIQRHRSTIA